MSPTGRDPARADEARPVRSGADLGDRPYPGKRLFDLAVLAAIAVPALVLALVCALAIRLTSRGPVVYSQQRVGLGEREFHIYKFRTMVMGQNPGSPELNRSTRVGRWLKRSSLDELPQLINVLRGDMSIVGPRPTFPYQVERYEHRQRRRHAVRPGLTGLAQVRGRNTLTWAERIEHDLEYVEHQSPGLDLRILLDTLGILRSGEGAEGHPPGDPIAADPDPSTEAGRREIARRRLLLP